LLHVDRQSGWTPWHDGDAEVTPQEAVQAAELLAALNENAARQVLIGLSDEHLVRLLDGLDGTATHANKPWGHWAWSPLQVPTRETKTWLGEASAAGSEFYAGIATGFAASATSQSEYSPYTAAQTEAHLRHAGGIVLRGSIPVVSNSARCAIGDGSSCVFLGAEIVLAGGSGPASRAVSGRVVSVLGRIGTTTVARVELPSGVRRIVSIIDGRLHPPPTAPPIITRAPRSGHFLNQLGHGTPSKKFNSIIEPWVDVDRDIRQINLGNATSSRTPGGEMAYTINGRTYGVHPGGQIYPISGRGMHQLGRKENATLKIFVTNPANPGRAWVQGRTMGLSTVQLARLYRLSQMAR
jgi:hypothetical protein